MLLKEVNIHEIHNYMLVLIQSGQRLISVIVQQCYKMLKN